MFGSTQSFPSLAMSAIQVGLVLFKSGILRVSVGISHMMLFFWLQMLWLEVILTIVIPCLDMSLLFIFAGSSVSRRTLLEILPIPPSNHITFQQVAYQTPFCIPDGPAGGHSVYRIRRSQPDGVLLEVPQFASIYEPKKHFGFSFAYDAQRIWNDLPDVVH